MPSSLLHPVLRRGPALLLSVLGALLLAAGPARGELIERILAVVDGRPLMLSEVELLERLKGLPREQALEALIDEALMFREAARLPAGLVSLQDEQRAYASLERQLAGDAAARLEGGLRRLARRQTAILKYIAFRFDPQVRVEDEALRAAYEAEFAGRPGVPDFEAAAGELLERLTRRALDEKVEAWVAELRANAEIRYNAGSLSPGAPR